MNKVDKYIAGKTFKSKETNTAPGDPEIERRYSGKPVEVDKTKDKLIRVSAPVAHSGHKDHYWSILGPDDDYDGFLYIVCTADGSAIKISIEDLVAHLKFHLTPERSGKLTAKDLLAVEKII